MDSLPNVSKALASSRRRIDIASRGNRFDIFESSFDNDARSLARGCLDRELFLLILISKFIRADRLFGSFPRPPFADEKSIIAGLVIENMLGLKNCLKPKLNPGFL
jgi:hypothetical protein